ncbi:hypothetical protein LDENG_00284880 [Xyrichtys novacula]|uniref:CCHC-type domain-containing protein n=1 Tax=Xyrichtys novacula TaxID=13765 RepID=A0AAV1H604_XYRNO|nr:hypothetical protein LDENG_00284880 [Xyrichtys novacula]
MDPAHNPSPLNRLETIEGVLQQHEAMMTAAAAEARRAAETQGQSLAALAAQMQQLAAQLTQLPSSAGFASSSEASPSAPAPVPASSLPSDAPEPRVGTPERYDGDRETCGPFLTNCSLLFALQPRTFATEPAKVAFVINHLTGRARLWGTAEWERRSRACASFDLFAAELRKVFGFENSGSDSARGLMGLKQGERTVADYSIDFRTRASQSGWNSAALRDAFLHGLADYIKDELVSHDTSLTLDGVIDLAVRIDLRVQTRRREKRQGGTQHTRPLRSRGGAAAANSTPLGQQFQDPEPMQLGCTSLSLEERERRRRSKLCLYCGAAGHYISGCPAKARAHQ